MVVADILTSAAVLYATTEVRKPRGLMVDHLNRLAMTSWRSERKLLVLSEDVDDTQAKTSALEAPRSSPGSEVKAGRSGIG